MAIPLLIILILRSQNMCALKFCIADAMEQEFTGLACELTHMAVLIFRAPVGSQQQLFGITS